MKKIIVSIFMLFTLSQSQEKCSIIEPRKILCKERVEASTVSTLYRMGYDDKWIVKRYYPKQGEKEETVFTIDYGKIDSSRVINFCIGAIVYEMDYSEIDSTKSKKIRKHCESYSKSLMNDIISGAKREITEILYYFQEDKTALSEIHCFTASYVRTYKVNKLTGLETDRKDYHGLKPATYCQDFFATDELYWKP